MSSFFTVPGAQKKRKRPTAPEAPKKRAAAAANGSKNNKSASRAAPQSSKKRASRDKDDDSNKDDDDDDESIISSGDSDDESFQGLSNREDDRNNKFARNDSESEGEGEAETAAEKRLRLAERYLDNVKEQHVDDYGFDAAEIDRDLIAERLQEDIAETKGKVYRQLAAELAFDKADRTFFRTNTAAVTAITACAPYVYTTTKDLVVHRWRIQDLPQHQYPQTTRRKPKKPPAPPKKRPELDAWVKGNKSKAKDNNYKRHVGRILAVAASSDGQFVVTGGEDGRMIVHEAATLKPIKVFSHHRSAVTGLAFRRGTNQLYSCSKDRAVKVWSLDELAYVESLYGHQDDILDIDALGQERCISVGARDRTARLWKVAEETQLVFRGGGLDKKALLQLDAAIDPRSLLHEGSMDRVAMIDDELFVTGSDNGALALWSVTKKKPVYIEPLAHGLDPPLRPGDVSADKEPNPKAVPAPLPRWITALKTIPYSDVILSGSWDGHIRVWRLSEDKKKIDLVAVLGGSGDGEGEGEGNSKPIPGVINDIAVFERGDRGKDGVCVVAAVGNEHRLGRWTADKTARNGGIVFEIPRIPKPIIANGKHGEDETAAAAAAATGAKPNDHDDDDDA